jgi:HEAT repeat protein
MSKNSMDLAINKFRSVDVQVQNQGIEEVIKIGKKTVPGLISLFNEKACESKEQVMFALAQIADPSAFSVFKTGINDRNEYVRAYSALGLMRIHHQDALCALLMTINDAPDISHLDITPSVSALSEFGSEAFLPLLELLMHNDEMTRLHAQRALELIVDKSHGFVPGQGFPSFEAEEQAREQWVKNGNYDYSGDVNSRSIAVKKLREFLLG